MRIIAGQDKGRKLKSLDRKDVRPTSDRTKEALFNILGPDVVNIRFLDLYAGFGGIGIEALSRGAQEAVFIDQDRSNTEIIEENLELTDNLEASRILVDDVLTALSRLRGEFELIFMDPPYQREDLYPKTLTKLAEYNLLHPTGIVIVEHHDKADIEWPAEYNIIKERNYGNAALTLLKGASDNAQNSGLSR